MASQMQQYSIRLFLFVFLYYVFNYTFNIQRVIQYLTSHSTFNYSFYIQFFIHPFNYLFNNFNYLFNIQLKFLKHSTIHSTFNYSFQFINSFEPSRWWETRLLWLNIAEGLTKQNWTLMRDCLRFLWSHSLTYNSNNRTAQCLGVRIRSKRLIWSTTTICCSTISSSTYVWEIWSVVWKTQSTETLEGQTPHRSGALCHLYKLPFSQPAL